MSESKQDKNKEAVSKPPTSGETSPAAAGGHDSQSAAHGKGPAPHAVSTHVSDVDTSQRGSRQLPAPESHSYPVPHEKPALHPKAKPGLSDKELAILLEKAAVADKHWDQLLRLRADFDNFRKRIHREREENVGIATETALKKLLPVLDDFERALPLTAQSDSPAIIDGIRLVLNKFRAALAELGLREISSVGQPFDPHLHEAIAQVHSDIHPEGIVVEQTRKGYQLGPRLLRPASVFVSKGKGAVSPSTPPKPS